jgi:hypothetical protein
MKRALIFVAPGLLRSARNDEARTAKNLAPSLRGARAPKQSSLDAQDARKKLVLINALGICFFLGFWPKGRGHLDIRGFRNYSRAMNIIRRTLDIDADTDARLREMAVERGQDIAAVLAEAVALLDSIVDIAGPDIAEDRRRLDDFKATQSAVPLDDVKAWVASWGSADELPRPLPRKIG